MQDSRHAEIDDEIKISFMITATFPENRKGCASLITLFHNLANFRKTLGSYYVKEVL
jgi:hypothetical protein